MNTITINPNTKARIDSIVQKLDDDCYNLGEEMMQLKKLYPILRKEENAKYFVKEYLDWAEKMLRDAEYNVPEDVHDIMRNLIDKMW